MSRQWFHSYRFPDGERADGVKPYETLKAEADIMFRHGLKGKSVHDVAAFDGFHIMEAEQRGAASTRATDWWAWGGAAGSKQNFNIVKEKFKSRVSDEIIDILALDPAKHGQSDVVLFTGVFYHCRDPFSYVERAAAMSRDLLIYEGEMWAGGGDVPSARFWQPYEMAPGDATNTWSPNRACVEHMLRWCGYTRFEWTPHPTSPTREFCHAWRV